MSKYKCKMCGGEFEDDWTDEEAKIEFVKNFGKVPDPKKMINICQDCYDFIMKTIKN